MMPLANSLWYLNKDIDHYNRLLEETCLNADIPFLNLWNRILPGTEKTPINWIKLLSSDDTHCNSAGHRWIFEQVCSWPELLLWAGLPPEGACDIC
jgi:lysophospholipase L1-like esterase